MPTRARRAMGFAGGKSTILGSPRFLVWIGLATNVVAPNAHLAGRRASGKMITRGSNGVPAD